jgi:hypothetical protein
MEVSWSKAEAIRRMLEDFPLLLLHDNARPHTGNKTNETLRNFLRTETESNLRNVVLKLRLDDGYCPKT